MKLSAWWARWRSRVGGKGGAQRRPDPRGATLPTPRPVCVIGPACGSVTSSWAVRDDDGSFVQVPLCGHHSAHLMLSMWVLGERIQDSYAYPRPPRQVLSARA